MKLYNLTKIDDKVIHTLLYRAAKAVGSIRTQNVVVKVTRARSTSGCVKGGLRPGYRVRECYLKGESYKEGGRLISSEGGFMFIRMDLSKPHRLHNGELFFNPLDRAESFYKLAAHEWRHIRDHQKDETFRFNRNWANRPHERRAINSAKRAMTMVERDERIQEAILNLGIEIEQTLLKEV